MGDLILKRYNTADLPVTPEGGQMLFDNQANKLYIGNKEIVLLQYAAGTYAPKIKPEFSGKISLSDGWGNVYVGDFAGQNSGGFSSSSNTAIGYNALTYNVSGGSTIAIGYYAAVYVGSGTTPKTTGEYGIYIGTVTRGSVDGTTNEIVIGNLTTGHGSNTVTIGNADITANYFSGTLNAPTVNATTDLQLNGTSINTTGILTNVAYKGQNNNFTVGQTIKSASDDDYAALQVEPLTLTTAVGIYLRSTLEGRINVGSGATLTGAVGGVVYSRLSATGLKILGRGTPSEALDVTGNIKASGNITAAGTVTAAGGTLSLHTRIGYEGILPDITPMLTVRSNGTASPIIGLGTSSWSNTGFLSVNAYQKNPSGTGDPSATGNMKYYGAHYGEITQASLIMFKGNGGGWTFHNSAPGLADGDDIEWTQRFAISNTGAITCYGITSTGNSSITGSITASGTITAAAPVISRHAATAYAGHFGLDGGMSLGSNNAGQVVITGGRKLDGTALTTFGSAILAVNGDINFYSYTGGTAGEAWSVRQSRLTIKGSNGFIGINNTSPAEALDVTGNIKASESLKFGTDLISSGSGNIVSNTADGADNATIIMCGGGSASVTRGAYVLVRGNNHATEPGRCYITSGNVTGSNLDIAHKGTVKIAVKDATPTIIDITGSLKATAEVAGPKVKMTIEGGIAVLLTNRTGGNSVKGEVVHISSAQNSSVTKVVDGVPDAIGVFYESGIANRSEAWVVVSGIADVYFIGNTTRGHLARTFISGEAGYVTGQAISEAVPSPPFDTDKHFCEIGHVLESRTGAGLAKCILHFN